jgi:hypothetical protein
VPAGLTGLRKICNSVPSDPRLGFLHRTQGFRNRQRKSESPDSEFLSTRRCFKAVRHVRSPAVPFEHRLRHHPGPPNNGPGSGSRHSSAPPRASTGSFGLRPSPLSAWVPDQRGQLREAPRANRAMVRCRLTTRCSGRGPSILSHRGLRDSCLRSAACPPWGRAAELIIR